MSELDKFKETFANKSKITQGVYISNYKKLRNLLLCLKKKLLK